MKIKYNFRSLLTVICLLGFAGCKQETTTTTPSAPSSAGGGHVHADGTEHAPHGGHGAGPHDGTVVDWGGGKYHVEFTVDHTKKESTVYILGSDEKTAVPIDAESIDLSISDPVMQVSLMASPQQGDPAGKASRFVGNHESLGVVQEYAGTIAGVIDGTPYSGDFTEEAHGAHGHSHDGDDALVWEGSEKEHAGLQIKLGHHGTDLHAGEEVEPAVSITQNGQPVSDAKVFNALVSMDGKTVLAQEVATVYEPPTAEEPAHYAQGALPIPSGTSQVVIRFRIVPNGSAPISYDVPVAVH